MASAFANQENSDSDSSWAEFTDEVWNSSVKVANTASNDVGTSKVTTNLHKIDDGEMVKSSSSEEFEVIDKSSDDDSDSFLTEVSIYREGIRTSAEPRLKTRGETSLPYLQTIQNLEHNCNTRKDKLGALYKPISKYLVGSKKEEAVFDNSKKSIIYSDDESRKAPSSHYNEHEYYHMYISVLAKNRRLTKYWTKKLEQQRRLLYFAIGIVFTMAIIEWNRTEDAIASKAIPKKTILTPVETSHLGWDALTEEFKPVLNMLNDRPDLDDEEECPAYNMNFKETKEKLRGISFKMLRNDMMISIGVDERKTFVIYEKNGIIDVKMIPENLANDTKLFFTLPEEISVYELMDFCPFIRFTKLVNRVLDVLSIALLLFVKILLGIAIALFRVLFWCVDFYMKDIWEIFRWQ